MQSALIIVVALSVVVNGDVTGQSPRNGACLCFTGNSVNIRSSGKKPKINVIDILIIISIEINLVALLLTNSLHVFQEQH